MHAKAIFASVTLTVLLGGCSLDDSGPVRSVFRPADGQPFLSAVVYLTDRLPDPSAAGGFGNKWADAPSCGIADTVLPPAGEKTNWGYLAKTHPTACRSENGSLGGAVKLIEAQAKTKGCRSVLVYVHGFHTGFDGAVLRTAQIAHDAQTACAAAAFAWTSEVKLNRYAVDLERSTYAQPLFEEFLRELSESGLRVTVLGHSMGARVTLATLSAIGKSRERARPGFIDELVLAAPDIGAGRDDDDFVKLLRAAAPYVRRTTVYASSNDSVLALSRSAHGGVSRAGENPAADYASDAAHEIDLIDASQPPADALDHSYYAMSYEALYDMALTLRSVTLADRLKSNGVWPPTLVKNDSRHALATARCPRLITRIMIRLAPLLP